MKTRVRLCCLIGLTVGSEKGEIKQERDIIGGDGKNSRRIPDGRGGTTVSNGRPAFEGASVCVRCH